MHSEKKTAENRLLIKAGFTFAASHFGIKRHPIMVCFEGKKMKSFCDPPDKR